MGSNDSSSERKKCGYSEHPFKPFQGYRDEPGKPHCLVCGHVWGECNWHWVKKERRGPDNEACDRCMVRPCGCLGFRPAAPDAAPKDECQHPADKLYNVGGNDAVTPRTRTWWCGECNKRWTTEMSSGEPEDSAFKGDWKCVHLDGCCKNPGVCRHGCKAAAEELSREAQRMEQPARRPPYAVSYSVGGQLYDLALPGDASAIAEDGVIKILHSDPVLGIVRVMPAQMEREESADGAT